MKPAPFDVKGPALWTIGVAVPIIVLAFLLF